MSLQGKQDVVDNQSAEQSDRKHGRQMKQTVCEWKQAGRRRPAGAMRRVITV